MLTVCRTLLHVSFVGGTDYPEYFERMRGAVVGMAINEYVYASYSKIETV
jgi:D-glycero-alpha-D-manno-heptose-7-phosphate kinase